MRGVIKIGTRGSRLALWQASKVEQLLLKKGYKCQIVPIKSDGDVVLDKPLYALGIVGIFTKALDVALLRGDIDIAVHSMKDVPTSLPEGIVQGAVLEREDASDILVHNSTPHPLSKTIATGSLRRRAQWLHRFPSYSVEEIRGNVISRLQRLNQSSWQGAIFSFAGLNRLNLLSCFTPLEWMLPAPSQGAIFVGCRCDDKPIIDILLSINHLPSEICTGIERRFLKALEGGCSEPIGAKAELKGEQISFTGNLLTPDGVHKKEVSRIFSISDIGDNPEQMAQICRDELFG